MLVREGAIRGQGRNRRVQQGNPVLHAEIDCLQNAGRLGSHRRTTLCSPLMPCCLCAGAAVPSRIPRVVAGESMIFPGAPDLLRHNGIEVVHLDLGECVEMMRRFIEAYSDPWSEDVGTL